MATTTFIVDDFTQSTSTIVYALPTEWEQDDWLPPLPSYTETGGDLPTNLFGAPTSTSSATMELLDKDIWKRPDHTLQIVLAIVLPVASFALIGVLYTWWIRDRVRQKRDKDRALRDEQLAKSKKFYKSELGWAMDALVDFKEPPKAAGEKSHPRGILKNRIPLDINPDDIYTLLPPKPKLKSGFSPKFSFQRYLDEMGRWNRAKEAIEKAQEAARAHAAEQVRLREEEAAAKQRAAEEYNPSTPELEAEEIIDDDREKERKRKENKDRDDALRKLEAGGVNNHDDDDELSLAIDCINAIARGEWVGDDGSEQRAHHDGDNSIKRHSWDDGLPVIDNQKRPTAGSRFIEEV